MLINLTFYLPTGSTLAPRTKEVDMTILTRQKRDSPGFRANIPHDDLMRLCEQILDNGVKTLDLLEIPGILPALVECWQDDLFEMWDQENDDAFHFGSEEGMGEESD